MVRVDVLTSFVSLHGFFDFQHFKSYALGIRQSSSPISMFTAYQTRSTRCNPPTLLYPINCRDDYTHRSGFLQNITQIVYIPGFISCKLHAEDFRRWVHGMQSGMYLIYFVRTCTSKYYDAKFQPYVISLHSSVHCNLPDVSNSHSRLQSMS